MVWTNAGQVIRRNRFLRVGGRPATLRGPFVTPALRCGHIPDARRLACTQGPYTPRVDIPPPPPPPPPPSPDDVPPPGPPSYDQNPYAQHNPYAQQPTQAAMPGADQPPQQPGYGYPGAPAGGYGYPGAQQPQQPQLPGYPGAPAGGYGYPGQMGPPQPYPVQPGYWQPERRSANGMSITALVLGLLPCIPLIGMIFGLIGLRQTRRRGERGKGMAITGIVGSVVWAVIWGLVITFAVLNTGNTQVADLKAGQCFNMVGEKLSDFGTDKKGKGTVDTVDCAKEHDGEVFLAYEMTGGSSYPGVKQVGNSAKGTCLKFLDTYLDGKKPPNSLGLYFYIPTYDNWNDDQRTVVCFLGSPGGKTTGTAKSDDGGDSSDTGGSGDGDSGGVGV